MMTKIVSVSSRKPIFGLSVACRGVLNKVELTTKEIRTCLINRAEVREVLIDGTEVRLDLHNYDKDNGPSAANFGGASIAAETTTTESISATAPVIIDTVPDAAPAVEVIEEAPVAVVEETETAVEVEIAAEPIAEEAVAEELIEAHVEEVAIEAVVEETVAAEVKTDDADVEVAAEAVTTEGEVEVKKPASSKKSNGSKKNTK